MIYNLLYIGDNNDTFKNFLNNTGREFNVVSTSNIQNALDTISSQTINCIVAGTSKDINTISLLEEFKVKTPHISRVLIVSEDDEDAIDYIYDYEVINKIDVMFALNEPYNVFHLTEILRTACIANGNDKKALFFSIVETVSNKIHNKDLQKQIQMQEDKLKKYVDELVEAKFKAVKLKEASLKVKEAKFKAVRLSWKSTLVLRALLFAFVSAVVGAYKSELLRVLIKIFSGNHE